MGKVLTYFFLSLFTIVLAGCGSSGCLDNQSSIPKAGFYDSSTGRQASMGPMTIGGIGAPNDSLILNGGTAMSVYLPFRSKEQTTAFFFRYGAEGDASISPEDMPADTIWFTYDTQPYFASEECGAIYRYRIRRMVHTSLLIDSVALVDSLISNVDIERIRIYFYRGE